MCGGYDRDRFARYVNSERQTRLVDIRKVCHDGRRVDMRNVQPDMTVTTGFQLVVNRAGNDITWRKFAATVVIRHESFPERFRRMPPSPRTASEMRKESASG